MGKSLEINVISARGIKNVNLISKMDVYAVVSITEGDFHNNKKKKKLQKAKTPVDRDGGTNPTWNYPLKFTIQEPLAQQNRLNLVFKLKCEGALGDKDIGEVDVPVKELLDDFFSGGKQGDDNGGQGRATKFVSYQVRKPSGKPEGELNFSYRVADVLSSSTLSGKYDRKVDQPVTAYPAPVAGPSATSVPPYPYYQPPPPPTECNYGYPPPPQTYYSGYPPPPPPPPAGYGYPPPPYGYPPAAGYGYPPPPVQQPPPRKNNFGMGLGAGLLGGVLGGLLIGDLVSDAGAYDAGYDAGFADAGGF